MSWTFQGISTLNSALEAFQTQLDVTGQNISNVNTPGYTEEQAKLVATDPTQVTQGTTFQLGSGVTVASVSRIQAAYLQGSAYSSASDLGMADQQASTASSVNGVVLDPGMGGLSNDLTAFFNSWSALATDPANSANKLAVQQAGQTISNDIQGTASGFQQLQGSNDQQIRSTIQSIQADVNQIASLNQKIQDSEASGGSPNALMDQRDQTVSDLASKINVTVHNTPGGGVTVSSGNLILVNQSGARTIPTTWDAASGSLTSGSTSYHIQSGQLAGLFDSTNKISSYQTSLNTLADQLRTQVNTIYATAANSGGATGAQFFSAGSGAANLSLDPAIASNPAAILTGTTGSASDGSVALSISGLANQQIASLGNQTISGYYSSLVGQIGTDGKNANTAQSTHQAINKQIQTQIQSVTGVNLDDEMANLLRFQRSYQAAAQALNAIDQSISTFLTTVH